MLLLIRRPIRISPLVRKRRLFLIDSKLAGGFFCCSSRRIYGEVSVAVRLNTIYKSFRYLQWSRSHRKSISLVCPEKAKRNFFDPFIAIAQNFA